MPFIGALFLTIRTLFPYRYNNSLWHYFCTLNNNSNNNRCYFLIWPKLPESYWVIDWQIDCKQLINSVAACRIDMNLLLFIIVLGVGRTECIIYNDAWHWQSRYYSRLQLRSVWVIRQTPSPSAAWLASVTLSSRVYGSGVARSSGDAAPYKHNRSTLM